MAERGNANDSLIADPKDFEELFAKGFYGSATFINDLPPYWQVNIVQIGCKFIDDDGNNDNKAANVNIPGGGQSQTLTSTYNGCCRAYWVVMKARAQDGKEWNLANATTVEAGYCGGNLKWHLVPETKFAQGSALDSCPFKLVQLS